MPVLMRYCTWTVYSKCMLQRQRFVRINGGKRTRGARRIDADSSEMKKRGSGLHVERCMTT